MRAEFLFYGRQKCIKVDVFGQQSTWTSPEFNVSDANFAYARVPTKIDRDKNLKDFLGEDEYAKFKEAEHVNLLLQQSYYAQNLIYEEIIYETVFIAEFNESFDVEIGFKTILADNVHPSTIGFTPEYSEWLSRIPDELIS